MKQRSRFAKLFIPIIIGLCFSLIFPLLLGVRNPLANFFLGMSCGIIGALVGVWWAFGDWIKDAFGSGKGG